MARLKRFGKRALVAVVSVVVACAILKVTLSIVYGAKVKREIAALKYEGGSPTLSELGPRFFHGGPGNRSAAQILQASWFLYDLLTPDAVESAYGEAAHLGAQLTPLQQEVQSRRAQGFSVRGYVPVQSEKIEAPTGLGRAARLYQMTRAYRAFNNWRGLRLARGTVGWDDAWNPYLEEIVSRSDMGLGLLKEAMSSGSGYVQVDWTNEEDRLSHLIASRAAARLLRLEAVLRARKGDVRAALDDVRLILNLRRYIDDEPLAISKLACYNTDSIAFAALQAVLDSGNPDRQSVEAILDDLGSREDSNVMSRAMLGETAQGIELFERLRSDDAYLMKYIRNGEAHGSPISALAPGNAFFRCLFKLAWIPAADEYNYLVTMRLERQIVRANALADRSRSTAPSGPWWPLGVLTRANAVRCASLLQVQTRADALARMARTVLALSLHKAENGAYPEDLQALVPGCLDAVQVDPFDDKPLKYTRDGEGFVLYSVGPETAATASQVPEIPRESSRIIWRREK